MSCTHRQLSAASFLTTLSAQTHLTYSNRVPIIADFCFPVKHFCFYNAVFSCFFAAKKKVSKEVSLRDLYAPNRIFFRNTASKIHGRRQPCRGLLSCLAGKPLVLECFAVLNGRFLFAGTFRGQRNTGCISRTMNFLRTKRFFQNRANP